MPLQRPLLPSTRREFLKLSGKGIGLLAFGSYAPAFLTASARAQAPAPEADRTILVLIQLGGGNDGLNTVIPYSNDNYFRLRPTLAIKAENAIRLDDQTGLHASLTPLHKLLDDGKLAIVQNVGYPNPNRSHFRSMEIWETGSDADTNQPTGWLGRYFDNSCAGAPCDGPLGVHSSAEVPQAFGANRPHSIFGISGQIRNRGGNNSSRMLLEKLIQHSHGEEQAESGFLKHTLMDALVTERKVQRLVGDYRPGASYPGSQVAQSLRGVASLIAGGLPTRVYFVSRAATTPTPTRPASTPACSETSPPR
jgi:uncharacterized protein (DUF1501 family)